MEVKQLFVTSINLVHLGETPFLRLLNEGKIHSVAQAFEFDQDVNVQRESGGAPRLRFQNGLRTLDSEHEVAIPRLDVQPRKIVLEVTGSSADAQRVYVAVAELFEHLISASKEKLLSPILHTEETIVTSWLSFSPEALFVNELLATTTAATSDTGSDKFTAHVRPRTVSFEVEYLPTDLTLSENRIGLSRKEFSIGPKSGFPLQDQIYQSSAPLDTDAHIAYLENLEAALSD